MNTANTSPDNSTEQERSRLLGALAGTSERTDRLLGARAAIRYDLDPHEPEYLLADAAVHLDIDGVRFGRAILYYVDGGGLLIRRIDTENFSTKTAPGAGSLLMFAVLAFMFTGDFCRVEWRSSSTSYNFYAEKFLHLFVEFRDEMGLRWVSDGPNFSIERLPRPPTKKDPEGSLVESC